LASRTDYQFEDRPDDQRNRFARDRDRVLYTSAFRRLAGVTQVAAAGEGEFFHNRLTHSLEVAQISRRLAERLLGERPDLRGLDPDVVETAGLAHDLGHPPFGHAGEEELDACVRRAGNPDGFEGNAQTFRILTKLAARRNGLVGLNLTRASLDATLKYPWFRQASGKRYRKFSAYTSERDEFSFARGLHTRGDDSQSIEAQIMDWADDIAYAVHDLYDFFRAHLIPLDRLAIDTEERTRFVRSAVDRWAEEGRPVATDVAEIESLLDRLLQLFPLRGPFDGSQAHRGYLREYTSALIGHYIQSETSVAAGTGDPSIAVTAEGRAEVEILKALTWHYVIENPALTTIQHGHRRVIRTLFRTFLRDGRGRRELLPVTVRESLETALVGATQDEAMRAVARSASDAVASLTEDGALRLYQRFLGVNPGSVLTPVV